MKTHFSGSEVSTNELRAELIGMAESGDKEASRLLKVLVKHREQTAGELVGYYAARAGSEALETCLAGIGLVCFGLVFGILTLAFNGVIVADIETLGIVLTAFVSGQCCLSAYHKVSTARHLAQAFRKLATVQLMSNLVRQQYSSVGCAQASPRYAYGTA